MNNINENMDEQEVTKDVIAGRNAVMEAIKSGKNIDCIHISDGEMQGSINKIKAMAREALIVVKTTTNQKLDFLCGGITHQGVVAVCACAEYATLDDILAVSKEKGTAPFIIIADEIEDPHNLGALIRTAEACGADGLIIPKRRSASLSPTVYKTSAGAAAILPVAKVSNLVACIKTLKEQNIWVYGADAGGKNWSEHNYSGGVALVIGSEGEGLGRLVKEECDFITTLPMLGKISSLNASVAGGVLMYEILRGRQIAINK